MTEAVFLLQDDIAQLLFTRSGPDAAQLEDALAAVHDRQFIAAHKFFAVMSSDAFKSYKPTKNAGKIFTALQSLEQVFLFGNQIRSYTLYNGCRKQNLRPAEKLNLPTHQRRRHHSSS